MILTDKCLKDFALWYNKSEYMYPITLMPKVFQNALIIEFFDSVGIYIKIEYIVGDFDYEIKDYTNNTGCKRYYEIEFETRQEATERAIKKANDIYNSRS